MGQSSGSNCISNSCFVRKHKAQPDSECIIYREPRLLKVWSVLKLPFKVLDIDLTLTLQF